MDQFQVEDSMQAFKQRMYQEIDSKMKGREHSKSSLECNVIQQNSLYEIQSNYRFLVNIFYTTFWEWKYIVLLSSEFLVVGQLRTDRLL